MKIKTDELNFEVFSTNLEWLTCARKHKKNPNFILRSFMTVENVLGGIEIMSKSHTTSILPFTFSCIIIERTRRY
jgi:hypothetical protein